MTVKKRNEKKTAASTSILSIWSVLFLLATISHDRTSSNAFSLTRPYRAHPSSTAIQMSHEEGMEPPLKKTRSSESDALYITIGPQCCGKTTLLSTVFKDDLTDICIDNEEGVYHRVPLQTFLTPPDFRDGHVWIYDKTLMERLTSEKETEMRLVLKRLLGLLDKDGFKEALQKIPLFKNQGSLFDDLIASVEHHMGSRDSIKMVEDFHVDLFVPDAIFRPPPRPKHHQPGSHADNSSALQKSTYKLTSTSSMKKIAWGNTNTRPREYQAALEAAQKFNRPVYFFCYGGDHPQLPNVGRPVLFQRNIHRFISTGRYINVKAIDDASSRTMQLKENATREIEKLFSSLPENSNGQLSNYDDAFKMDAALASLAGFRMGKDRMVTRLPSSSNGNHSAGRRGADRGRNSGRGGGRGGGRNGDARNYSNQRQSQSRPESGSRYNKGNPIRAPGSF